MAATSRDETTKRLNRLAGSGRGSGGGLPLPGLFSALLNEVLDNAPVSTERMTEITSSVLDFKQHAVSATWPTWEALTADVLAQMESRGLIRDKNGSWERGDKLVTGELLEVIPARKGVGSKSDGVTVWDKAERAERSRTSHIEREATSLIANPRPVDRNHVQEIRDSLSTTGRLYPVLTDKNGRLLDGRHRRAADPGWPHAVALRADGVPVSTEAEALAVIRAAGLEKPLPSATVKDIDRLLGEMAKSGQIKRDRIKAALLEDASHSNRAVAEDVGVDHHTVATVRAELQVGGEIPHLKFLTGGRGNKSAKAVLVHEAQEGCCDGLPEAAPPPTVPDVPVTEEAREEQHREFDEKVNQLREEGFSQRQIAEELGATFNRVQDSWQREEGRRDERRRREAVARATQGTPPSAPSAPQPAVSDASTESVWDRIAGRLERLGRLAQRWKSTPPDPASELEELEALKRDIIRDIDERIEALRR